MANQYKIIEALNLLHDKVASDDPKGRIHAEGLHEAAKANVHAAVQPVDDKVNSIMGKINHLE